MKLPQLYSKLSPLKKRRVREKYIEVQDGKCYWCGEDIFAAPPLRIEATHINKNLFPLNFFNYPIHLQHNHSTDETEGAVHARCNAVMWQYHRR